MIIEKLSQMLRGIERIERNQYCSLFIARMNIARKLGIKLGTLENLIYTNRVKTVEAHLPFKIADLYRETIEAEIRRLEHERQLLCQMGLHNGRDEVAEIEACLTKAKTMLDELAHNNRLAMQGI